MVTHDTPLPMTSDPPGALNRKVPNCSLSLKTTAVWKSNVSVFEQNVCLHTNIALSRKSVAHDVNLSFDEIGKHECPLKFTLKSSDLYTKFEHEDLYATFSWKVNFKLVSRKENFYI